METLELKSCDGGVYVINAKRVEHLFTQAADLPEPWMCVDTVFTWYATGQILPVGEDPFDIADIIICAHKYNALPVWMACGRFLSKATDRMTLADRLRFVDKYHQSDVLQEHVDKCAKICGQCLQFWWVCEKCDWHHTSDVKQCRRDTGCNGTTFKRSLGGPEYKNLSVSAFHHVCMNV
jgi:hypothetical protein